jgi:hypothetical protein
MNHFFRSSSMYFILVVVFGCNMTKVRAQDAALAVLSGGREDANRLVGAYVGPLGRGFSQALGQNWFNTANSLKLLRFNVQAGATMLTLPETDRTFDANALGLQNIRPLGGQADRVPTIAGERNAASPSWVVFGTLADSTAPGGLRSVALDTLPDLLKGLGMRNVFAPYIQANIGLIKNTELNIRYAPVLDLSTVGGNLVPDNLLRGEIRFWGAGIKHELLQWIPVLKRFPLSMSIYANHSRMSYALDTRVDGPSASDYPRTLPGNLVLADYRINGSEDFSKQRLFMEGRATGLGLILSKKILMVTGFASLGMQESTFRLVAEGNYPVRSGLTPDPNNPLRFTEEWTSLNKPLDIETKSNRTLRMGVGVRAKILMIAVHAEAFTLGEYKGYCGGLSVGF